MSYHEWDSTPLYPLHQAAEANEAVELDGSTSIEIALMHTSRAGGTANTTRRLTRGAAWDLLDELHEVLSLEIEEG